MDKLKELYYDAKSNAAFSGTRNLYSEAKRLGLSVTQKQVKEFLSSQTTYKLHRQQRHRYKRRRFIALTTNDLWAADLADMSNISRQNAGVNYLLVIVDVWSKYLRVLPLKNKKSDAVISAFKAVFNEAVPKKLVTDKGSEFISTAAQKMFEQHNINAYTTKNVDVKAAPAERVIRTLKSKIYKYLHANSTKRYIDVLPDLVNAYNNSEHSVIKMRPAEVKSEHQRIIRNRLYPATDDCRRVKYKVGDRVKVAVDKNPFYKGYLPQFTEEDYVVSSVIFDDPPVYKLKDFEGNDVLGTYYEQQFVLSK